MNTTAPNLVSVTRTSLRMLWKIQAGLFFDLCFKRTAWKASEFKYFSVPQFSALVLNTESPNKGNVTNALKLLTDNMQNGILPLNHKTLHQLMQKHPQGKQAEFDVLLTDDKYTRTITSNEIWRNRCLLSKKSSS